MDFELIERGNVFIFNTFEEYTYAIARILQMNFSEKYVFFLDPKAALFFEDNERLSVLPNMQSFYLEYKHLLNKSIFLIDSQRKCKYNFDNWISKKYCSLELMTSLFWCCDVVSFGEKNPDKIFYLIKNPLGGGGLADLIKFTLFRVEMVCQKNVSYIPVVDLSLKDDDNQFTHGNGDNAWTYFFEPVSEYSLEEVYQSKNVIISKDRLEFFNPYLNEQRTCANWREMFRKYLKFNKASEEYVQNMFSQIYPSEQERVLGVIGRGTDYNNPKARMVPRPMDPAIFLANVEQQFVRGKYDKIFLATEDAQVFDLFMQSSLKDYIFYIEQERFDYSDPTNKELYLADIKRRAEHDGYTDNLRYLSVLYTLSKCNGLMSTCICGAANVALALNDGMYEEVKIF